MKIRAISLHQPYASAVAFGSKRNETRSKPTAYRGPIAIHASKRRVLDELIHLHCTSTWQGALWPLQLGDKNKLWDAVPFGAFVAITEIIDCKRTDDCTLAEIETWRSPPAEQTGYTCRWTERQMGDYALGRFVWKLGRVAVLPKPIPATGRQFFWQWEVPAELHAIPAIADLVGPF